jgi:osmotically inducible protein OsmC
VEVAVDPPRIPAEQIADVAIDAKVMLVAGDDGRFRLGVELGVELPSLADPVRAAELVRATHEICPYSLAIRGNVAVALSVNGAAVPDHAVRAAR